MKIASFDPARLRLYLEGDRAENLARMRALLSEPPFDRYAGDSLAGYREQVLAWCRHLAGQGYGKLGLPTSEGGDPTAMLDLVEAMALFDYSLMVKFGVHFGLVQHTLARLGTDYHRGYLAGTASLEKPTCFAMTETDHGSNVRALETTAHYQLDRQQFVLHTPHPGARKDYIGSAALHGQQAIVFAQLWLGETCHGVHAFLVPLRDPAGNLHPGVEIEDCGPKMGLNGVDNGRISFNQVRVARENLLDRYGQVAPDGAYRSSIASESRRFFTMLSNLVAGRITLGAASLAGARSALAIAIRYASQRRQFGKSGGEDQLLLDYQLHQRRLMPRLATAYAVDAGVRQLGQRYLTLLQALEGGSSQEDRELETFAAALKAFSSWSALDTLQACRECCGGAGYLAENRFAALRADVDIFTTFEGDNSVLCLLVARNRLDYLRRLGPLARLRWLVRQYLPPLTRFQRETHGPEFLRAALVFREQRLLGSLARRVRSRLGRGLDLFDSFNQCQDHAVQFARAFTERVLFDCLAQRVRDCPEPELAGALGLLLELFATSRLESDAGFFLEHGYLSGSQSRAMRGRVLELCAEVREHALAFVESFGIPEALLSAPIAGFQEVSPRGTS